MKFFVYLLSIIVIIALLGLFVLKKPDRQPWLIVDDLSIDTQEIEKKVVYYSNKFLAFYENFIKEGDSQVKIYRWKDSNGNWSYSDDPNSATHSEEVFLDPKAIVILPTLDYTKNNLPSSIENKVKVSQSPLTTPSSKVLSLYQLN